VWSPGCDEFATRCGWRTSTATLTSSHRTTPAAESSTTGVAHLLGIADTPLARIGRTVPMLVAHQLVLLGYDPADPDSYDADALTARPTLKHLTGVPLAAAGRVLELPLAAPGASALILTEVNPTHDPAGAQLDRYIDAVTQALAHGLLP